MADINSSQFGNVKQVAEITGISLSTLNKWRRYRPEASPPFARVGRRILYPLTGPKSVSSWIEARLEGGAT